MELLKQLGNNINSFIDNFDCVEAFMNFSPIPIIIFDKDWKIIRWSKKAEEVFGWEEDELLNKNLSEINFVYIDDIKVIDEVSNEIKINQTVKKRNRNYCRDGSVVLCEWENVGITNSEGIIVGYLTFSTDISEIVESKKKIEESKRYFETFVESLPISVFYLNCDLVIKNYNHTFSKLFFNDKVRIENTSFINLNFVKPSNISNWEKQIKNFINSSENTYISDVQILCADNEIRDFFINFTKHFNIEGKLVGLFATLIDITKINKLSKELNESIKLYQHLFNTSFDAIVFLSVDWEIIDANNTFSEIFELKFSEIKGKKIFDIVDLPFFEEELNEFRHIDEIITTKKDGSQIILNAKIWPKIDYRNRKTGYWIILRDITADRELRKRLLETQARYEIAVECSNDGLWSRDLLDKRMWLSPKLRQMLEMDLKTDLLDDESILGIIHPDDLSNVFEQVQKNFSEKKTFSFDFRLKTFKSEEYRWYNVKGNAIFDENGTPIKMAGNLQDIHEKKLLEEKQKELIAELNRSNEELQQFAYVASHDLQEPLRMISSFLQLFKTRYYHTLNKEATEFINFALEGSLRMQQMINDLLTYSRVKTRPGKFAPTDLNRILYRVIETLKHQIKEKSASIYYNELPKTIVCDEGQLFQLFMNLLSNSLKFCKTDCRPEIFISFDENEKEYIFKVKDNGIGIDDQFKDKVFKIFQRLHTREEFPGNGIGLAICKRIVSRHNGKITFESELNKGTTFIFSIAKNLKDDAYEL